jgi:acetyl-CoA C-acetyltransferase
MGDWAGLDPRTPVLVGGGQAIDRLGAADYAQLSAVGLAAKAAQAALADCGTDPTALTAAVDTIAGVRQFEIQSPFARAPLGRADNYPRAVAARIGADPGRAILEVIGGQAPQHLVTELAGSIAAGRTQVALIVGSEAISTARHFAAADDRPDFTETVGGSLEDRGYGLAGLRSRQLAEHGLTDAPSQYALLENARRAREGLSRAAYAAAMGALFAPFTKVAAANPFAASPVERDAAELVTPTEANRLIADPYPRYLVARDQVNQGAAVLLASIAAARRLGVPAERCVFLAGHADAREQRLLTRPDLSRSPAAARASEVALELAGITMADVATIDLYSCFPIPVFNICDAFGLAADDPRGLTLTGGLPYFGGAGNNYSMHAIVETLHRARQAPGSFGFVGANGGIMGKYSAGVYTTRPTPWQPGRSGVLQASLDERPRVEIDRRPHGPAVIETFTVRHGRDGHRRGIVIGRLHGGSHLDGRGRRFVATVPPGDQELLDLLGEGDPVGVAVYARAFASGNHVTRTGARMDGLFPARPPGLREEYEHVTVGRDGHLLEVTINRPEVRNALHPPANDELDEIFDAYFADPDLWVAILTGAVLTGAALTGTGDFCAGHDLAYVASGHKVWVPLNGQAGLTSRARLPKPVIAAVNGLAQGPGCEIALACHLVVADAAAVFGLGEVRSGQLPGAGGLVRLPRAVPEKIATELIVTGRRMTAAEAHRWGLVNRVTEAGGALAGARELAGEILAGSPSAVRSALQIMADTRAIADTVTAVTSTGDALDDAMLTDDAAEGMKALAEHRAPKWRNR